MILYLNGIYVGLLILANIVAVKLFSLGDLAILPAAVVVFIFTYPIIDIIVELYGKEAGKQTVKAGLITQILAIIFIMITIQLPAAPVFGEQASFQAILGGSFRVIVASLVSYFISQHIVVYVFHKLKMRHGKKKLWFRNNMSVMISQIVDTSIFITIAFYGTIPTSALLGLIFSQYLFKFIASICITPLVYLVVHMIRKREFIMEKV
ncbi:queuosine precursor transporter [Cytobacillus sp. FSL R7-0680]|uniref:queuosine precursor transporter n=1 Tax=Cytobacillus sp. FSL R7-0680 TaxID=2921689 RepID=UPI0030F77344